ncbi:putative transcriptional regulatory protein TcrX [Phycisphaerales bacterium]|nr:putative transcriptional regulatory protein TcrX [Phycisphaerales bacterium]
MSSILLVEHEPFVREPLAGVLKHAGHEVRCAGSAQDALSGAKTQRPDLIVLDAELPRQDGLRVLEYLQADADLVTLPVLVIANPKGKDDIVSLARRGAKHILLKQTFTLEAFVDRVRSCLVQEDSVRPSTAAARSEPPHVAAPMPVPACAAPTPAAPPTVKPTDARSRDTLKEMTPLVTAEELRKILDKSGELHALSPAVGRVMQMASRPDVPADDIARVIKQDPGIAMKILKLANSAVYTRGAPVDSVLCAVRRIGMEQIRQAVMNIGVVEQFSGSEPGISLDTRKFWEHSIAVGLFAAGIIAATGGSAADTDAAFTMGLLHDVGRVLLAEQLGNRYTKVIEASRHLELPLEVVEKRLLGCTHADFVEKVLTSWRFAGSLVKPVVLHHASVSAIQQNVVSAFKPCIAVALANRIAHAILAGDSGSESIASLQELAKAVSLKDDAITTLLDTVPPQVEELKLAMLAATPSNGWPCARRALAKRLPDRFQPVYVGKPEGWEACRLLTATLRGITGTPDPTMAVLGATCPEDVAAAKSRLEAADKEAGATLSLLIVNWSSKPLEPPQDNLRRAEVIHGPFQLQSFCHAARRLNSGT